MVVIFNFFLGGARRRALGRVGQTVLHPSCVRVVVVAVLPVEYIPVVVVEVQQNNNDCLSVRIIYTKGLVVVLLV